MLIVTNTLLIFDDFSWDGIILAGQISVQPEWLIGDVHYDIDGLVVAGLDGLGVDIRLDDNQDIHFNRCFAFKAGKRLSHFRPMGSTWWEEM